MKKKLEFECVGGPLDGQIVNEIPEGYGWITVDTDKRLTNTLYHWPIIIRFIKFFKKRLMLAWGLVNEDGYKLKIQQLKNFSPRSTEPLIRFYTADITKFKPLQGEQ